jgi:hypothetical protein
MVARELRATKAEMHRLQLINRSTNSPIPNTVIWGSGCTRGHLAMRQGGKSLYAHLRDLVF